MRNHYWTCSKFADWVRGTPKLTVGTSEEWDSWTDKAKGYNPVRYWLAEEGLDILQGIFYYVPDKIYSFKYYINNRFVTCTHALRASPIDVPRGQWRDLGDRFLPCLFNELVDFVEVELAWWHIAWASKEDRAKYRAPFWATGWFRWRTWRCRQAGLDNLDWQCDLRWKEEEVSDPSNVGKPTPQAINAREILDLYYWWTVTYRSRPDPYEVSGWSAYCEASRQANGGKLSWGGHKDNPALAAMSDTAHKKLDEIEKSYLQEDEEMLIRLIKIRHSLWT